MKIFKVLPFLFAGTLLLPLCALSSCKADSARCEYAIEAEYFPDERRLSATMDFSYYNDTENALSVLEFNLYPNAFREGATYEPVSSVYRSVAYYDGESYGYMQISSVENCASWEVGGEDENILFVTLNEEVYPEERVGVRILFDVTLAAVRHRTGVSEKVVNLGNFYPVLCAYEEGKGFYECLYYSDGDPFYSACADYSVSLTAPSDYEAAASAPEKKTEEADGKTTRRYRLENARDFAVCLSSEFSVREEEVNGVSVRYCYTEDTAAEQTFSVACGALRYFSSTFGEYAYEGYTLVQTGFCYGGMEYPGMVMLSDSLEEEEYLYTVVHETAHQWWYAMVGNNQLDYAWMDEGLAEYSTVLFYEANPQYGKTRSSLVENALAGYKAYYTIYQQIFGESDTSMSRNLSSFVSEYEYVNVTYHKGVILFDTLRTSIGDDRFFAGLQDYCRRYTGKIASSEEMIDCFRRTGVDVNGLFASFTQGKAVI